MKKSLLFVLFISIWHITAQTSPQLNDLSDLENAYRQAKITGDNQAIANAAVSVAEVYLKATNYKRSTDFLLVAKDIYKAENNSKNLIKVSCLLAQNYYRSGNNKRYNDYISVAQQLIGKDTLSSEYLLLLDTQIGYFTAKNKPTQAQYLIDKKAELTKLIAPKKVSEARVAANSVEKAVRPAKANKPAPTTIAPTTNEIPKMKDVHEIALLLAVCIALLFAGGLIYYLKKHRRLKLIYSAQYNTKQSQLFKNIAAAIKKSASGQTIANQLSMLGEITAGKKVSNFEYDRIGTTIQAIVSPFLQQAAAKNITIISNIETSDAEYMADKKTLESILTLLWDEALLHAQPQNSVYFSAIIDKQHLDIRISYPCESINKEQLEHLFDQFYKVNADEALNPVGFALLQALVNWYDGSIEATPDGNLLRIATLLPLSEKTKQPKHLPTLVL